MACSSVALTLTYLAITATRQRPGSARAGGLLSALLNQRARWLRGMF